MRAQRAVAAAVAMAALAGPLLAGGAVGAEPPLRDLYAAPVPTVNVTLNVTVVLAGINLTSAERAEVLGRVNTTWWPSITSVDLPLGVNVTVRTRLVEASPGFVAALGAFLEAAFANDTLGRVVGNYVGLFENVSGTFPSWDQSTPVAHADADEAAAWLAQAGATFPEVAARGREARLFLVNPYTVEGPYYYAIHSQELDRATRFVYETANAWGNGAGVFFQDLRAAPSHLGEGASGGRPANFVGAPPLWSYGASAAERTRLMQDLASYVDATVRIMLSPSFGVTPFAAGSLRLDVTLFDATSAQTLFEPGGVGTAQGVRTPQDILSPTRAAAALGALVPYSAVTVSLTVADRAGDPQLAQSVEARTRVEGGASLLDPFGLNEDMRGRFAVPALPVVPGEAVVVPAVVVVTDGTAWIDAPNVRGVTLQRSDGRAVCIVIAAGLDQLETLGFTETLVHEGGHALGLGHPHEVGWLTTNGTAFLETNWLRTSSSTPMTYLPNYVDASFHSFDRTAIAFGAAAATLGEAYQLRQDAFARFDARGYNESTLPADVRARNAAFEQRAVLARAALAGGPAFEGEGPAAAIEGAVEDARAAFEEARQISVASLTAQPCCGPRRAGFLPGPDAVAVVVAVAGVASWARAPARGQRRTGGTSKAEYRDVSRMGVGRSVATADSTSRDSAAVEASSLACAWDSARASADSTRPR